MTLETRSRNGGEEPEDGAAMAVTARSRKIWGWSLLTDYGIIWATLLVFVVLALASDSFLTLANLRNLLDQQAFVLIAGAAMTITLIGGNFDISLSACFINATIATVLTMNATGSWQIALLAGIAVSALFGTINGAIVAWARINSFIATLATSFVFYGTAFLMSNRSIIGVTDIDFSNIARGRIFGITKATWIMVIVVAVFWILLSRTRFGRHVYATGGNPEAAHLAGIRVKIVTLLTFVLTGAATGLAGALSASRTMVGQPHDDYTFVFAVLTAVIVGGTSIAGGEGAIWRTLFGAVFIALLGNGFTLLQIDPIIQRLIQGGVIVLAVVADNWTRSRRI